MLTFVANCNNEQKVSVRFPAYTPSGHEAQIQNPQIVIMNTTGPATMVQDPDDPLKVWVVSQDVLDTDPANNVTTFQFSVSGDADLGEGVKTISDTGTGTLVVISAEASNFVVTVGEAVPK